MPGPKPKLTPEENRHLLLAVLVNSLGALTIAFSVAALRKMDANWFYVGLGIGIAICVLGNIRIFAVTRQISRDHENEKSN